MADQQNPGRGKTPKTPKHRKMFVKTLSVENITSSLKDITSKLRKNKIQIDQPLTSILNAVWFQYLRNNVKGPFMHNGSDENFWELLTFLIWENRVSAKVEKIFLKYVQGRDICNKYF